MYVDIGCANTAVKDIHKVLNSISEDVDKLEDRCVDSCMSCRNVKFKMMGDGFVRMSCPQCTLGHWVYRTTEVCCQGKYHSQCDYVPTQEFLKLKLRLKKFIAGVRASAML